MCALCGILGADGHWTVGAAPGAQSVDPRERRLARAAAVRAANRLLAPSRMTLRDWGGDAYVLRSATGAQAIVMDLAGVWTEAERLGGRSIDPLGQVDR